MPASAGKSGDLAEGSAGFAAGSAGFATGSAAFAAGSAAFAAGSAGCAAGSAAFAGAAPSGGGGIDSRRGFGGGASLRDEAPGGTESTRGAGSTGPVDSTVMVSSMLEIDGELLLEGGGGGRPLDIAALEPGGGLLGVPTETTRWLGIFGGGAWLTGGGWLALGAGGGTLGGWLLRSEGFVVMKP